jgi:hypothetical protein
MSPFSFVCKVYDAIRRRMARIEQRQREPDFVRMDIDDPGEGPSTATQAPCPAPKRASVSDGDLFGSYMTPREQDVDELTRYIRMTASDVGDDSDVLLWWKTQVRNPFPQLMFFYGSLIEV